MPPVVALQDQPATFERVGPAYCKVDWRLFDPATLAWRSSGAEYVERLNASPR